MVESTDGQKPDSSDAESTFSEASDTGKAQDKPKDFQTRLAIATLADDVASSQESGSERLGRGKRAKFKVPKVPDEVPAEEVVEVSDSTLESDDSVEEHKGKERKGRSRKKKSDKEAQSSEEPKDSAVNVVANADESQEDKLPSQSSQERSLRSRSTKNTGSQEINNSVDVPSDPSSQEKNSEKKSEANVHGVESDDDIPLNQLKTKNDSENTTAAKSPGSSKSDAEDDTPLSLFLTRSQSSDGSKSSLEMAAAKNQKPEHESMDVADTAPPQSCADMFADSPLPEDNKESKEESQTADTPEVESTAKDPEVNEKPKGKGKGKNVQFVKTGRGRRGRLSLDSRKRKSPGSSSKDALMRTRSLGVKGRRPTSPIVAISPLSKANKALVEEQLSQILNTNDGDENATEGENSKVEVVDLKPEESSANNQKNSDAQSNEKQTGTLHSLNKGVSKSPPKKGRPFDTPETPTSASKFTSRSQYILERSRRICLAKASPSPLSGRKLLVPKKSPRSILKNSPNTKSPEKASGPLAAIHNSPQASKLSTHSSGSPPTFRPIQVPKIYSPSASPSAGILKRRRLSGDTPAESPSPPNKVCTSSCVDFVLLAMGFVRPVFPDIFL